VAWDANRTVPWQRLVREWLLYVGIMGVVFVLFFRDNGLIGILAGLLASGPMYLAFGYVLAKLGYQRKSLRELRAEPKSPRRDRRGSRDADVDVAATRAKPAPTRRTGGGGVSGRPGGSRRKRR
jgi:hypothetical protein